MKHITRNFESDPGMTQEEALIALQRQQPYKEGGVISSIRKKGNVWVATVIEPKVAGENPFEDSGSEKKDDEGSGPPSEDSEESIIEDELGGGPDDEGPLGEGDDKPEDKGSTEDKMLHVLEQILHAVGGGAPDGLGGPDALGPGPEGPPGPPAPKGGPPGAGAPPKGPTPRPMKPGETPPGGTPIGAPAFASTTAAGPGAPVPTGQPQGQVGPVGEASCPQCGGPVPCPVHGGGGATTSFPSGDGLGAQVASYAGRAATITLSTDGSSIKQAVEEARPAVEAQGYQVKQAKRGDDGRIHILASRR